MHEQHKACELREEPKLYKIGMFANMNRVTIKTLRYYDEQNLIKPVYVDEKNGYRYYEASQIADLHRILALRGMGFSIEDIRRIINGEEEKKDLSWLIFIPCAGAVILLSYFVNKKYKENK